MPSQNNLHFNLLESSKEKTKFQDAQSGTQYFMPSSMKVLSSKLSPVIHSFVCLFWHFPQETTGRFIHINYSQPLELWHSWSINVQITPDYMSLNNIIPEPAHFQPVVIKCETLGEIKNPNQKILVLLNTPLGLSLLAKKIAASGKEIGTWHIKLVSDSKNTPM